MLSDVLGQEECEAEDIIGEATFLSVLNDVVGKELTLNQDDRGKGSVVAQVRSAAERHGVELATGGSRRSRGESWSRGQQ